MMEGQGDRGRAFLQTLEEKELTMPLLGQYRHCLNSKILDVLQDRTNLCEPRHPSKAGFKYGNQTCGYIFLFSSTKVCVWLAVM